MNAKLWSIFRSSWDSSKDFLFHFCHAVLLAKVHNWSWQRDCTFVNLSPKARTFIFPVCVSLKSLFKGDFYARNSVCFVPLSACAKVANFAVKANRPEKTNCSWQEGQLDPRGTIFNKLEQVHTAWSWFKRVIKALKKQFLHGSTWTRRNKCVPHGTIWENLDIPSKIKQILYDFIALTNRINW